LGHFTERASSLKTDCIVCVLQQLQKRRDSSLGLESAKGLDSDCANALVDTRIEGRLYQTS
jgi:hypothetical protein